jgi:GT2 family glycosyltransferase
VYLDNYSRDGSLDWIRSHHPEIDLLLSPRNELYCVGTNVLLQYAERRFSPRSFILVDADNFAEPDAYQALLSFADDHPQHGMVQPLVRSRNDRSTVYSCGHRFTEDLWCRTLTEIPEDRAVLLDLPSCSISSSLVRREVFEDCGILNPIYEIYYESADLSFRSRGRGFRCGCALDAVTYNEGTEAEGPDSVHHRFYFNRNRLIFWKLHDGARFERVYEESCERLRELERALEETEFGLDPTREGIRRGLADGVRIVRDPSILQCAPVALQAFDKSAAILIQEGKEIR